MNSLKTVAIVIAASLALAGCGSSVESDAKKLAELQCKAQKLAQKAASGDMSVMNESTQLAAEAATVKAEIEGKYTTAEEKAELAKAYLKAMQECK